MPETHHDRRWNGWGGERDGYAADWNVLRAYFSEAFHLSGLLASPGRSIEEWTPSPPRLSVFQIEAFVAALGPDRISLDDRNRMLHAAGRRYRDLLALRTLEPPQTPDAILYPRSRGDVAAILRLASELDIRITPYCAGAGFNMRDAPSGFVSLDLSGLADIIQIDDKSARAFVQAGVKGPALERALAARGWTLGHYPETFEHSTVGGWIAMDAGGDLSLRYGGVHDWLLSATMTTPEGFWTAAHSPCASSDQDLRGLIIGAGGDLGTIADVTIRLRPKPDVSLHKGYSFPSFAAAADAARALAQSDFPCAGLRVLDDQDCALSDAFMDAESAVERLRPFWRNGERLEAALIVTLEGARRDMQNAARGLDSKLRRFGAEPVKREWIDNWGAERFRAPYRRDALFDHGLGYDVIDATAPWSVAMEVRDAVIESIARADAALAYSRTRNIVAARIAAAAPDAARLRFAIAFPQRIDAPAAQWRALRHAAARAIERAGGRLCRSDARLNATIPGLESDVGGLERAIADAARMAASPTQSRLGAPTATLDDDAVTGLGRPTEPLAASGR